MQVQITMNYKTQKRMNKLWGKQRAFEIALGRKLVKMIKLNYE